MSVIIGIPARYELCGKDGLMILGVRKPYVESITAVGGIPLLIPLDLEVDQIIALYKSCHGILLTGGEDVEPKLYNEKPHPKLGGTSAARDFLESNLVKLCLPDKKPLFTICRGIQILNATMGGTLYQDIGDQVPNACVHRSDGPDNHLRELHKLKLDADCKIAQLIGADQIGVNSTHHQAIKDLAPGLKRVGSSEDGLVEAVEGEDKNHFLVGVQCHPEALWQAIDARWLKLFKGFVEAAERFKI